MAASKPPQILQLIPPQDIVFEGPYNQVVTSYLELRNPSDQKVCFKVKTTAPRRYCVRPNSGIVDPDKQIKIAIMLQPIEEDSQAERNKHKFMVQSTIIRDDSSSLETVWQTASPEDVMDSKLRCVFLPAQPDILKEHSSKNKINLSKSPSSSSNTPAPDTTSTTQQQQPADQKLQQNLAGDTSKGAENTSSAGFPARIFTGFDSDKEGRVLGSASKAKKPGFESSKLVSESSHNLTSSFLQPMSDDYKLVLVSLAMLFIGVILGKYII